MWIQQMMRALIRLLLKLFILIGITAIALWLVYFIYFLGCCNNYLQGDGAPTDVHPSHLQKLGRKQWTPITTGRLEPRQSKELLDNTDQYERFINAFEDVFDWQSEIVSSIFSCHLLYRGNEIF